MITFIMAIILAILPTEIITLLAPLVVYGVTELVKFILPKLPGWAILTGVVPLLSVVAAFIATLIIPGLGFAVQVVLGLLSVFVAEAIRQFKQGNNKSSKIE